MELQQLRYFEVIARYQNISHAANELYMAQPALSQSMKNLENDLGVQLFVRTGRRIQLSHCGYELQRRLQSILPQIDSLVPALQEIERKFSSSVTVHFAFGSYYIPMLMNGFYKLYPEISLQFLRAETMTPFDMAVTARPPSGNMDGVMLVSNEEYYLLVPQDSHLASKEKISLLELKDQPFVLPIARNNYSIRDVLDELFQQAGFRPTVSVECGFTNLIPDLVRLGLGITLQTRLFPGSTTDLTFVPISEPPCSRDLYLVWSKDSFFTSGMIAFKNYATSFFEQING